METRVAKILSNTEVVLACGSDQQVQTGDEFLIYEEGDTITDPATGQALGSLEILKGRVEVIHVMAKICTARSVKQTITKTRWVNNPTSKLFGGGFFGGPQQESYEVEIIDKLKIEAPDPSYENRRTVKVGDRARRISRP